MKVVSTDGLTKLIQLIKSSFISNTETEQTMEIDTSVVNEVTLATVATTGDYDDLTNKPDLTAYALDANVVHKTGDETIADTKTFTSSINVPQSDSWFDIIKMAGSNRPYITGYSNASKTCLALCTVRNNYYDNIELHNNGDGTGYTICPASDVNGSIVTTVSKSKASNGYFKLGNGLIIQWGTVTGSGNSRSVTYPTAFSNTNYKLIAMFNNSSQPGRTIAYDTTTTTGCVFHLDVSTGMTISWIAIGY